MAFGYIDINAYRNKYRSKIDAGEMADHPVTQMHAKTGRVYKVIRTMYGNLNVYVLVRYLLTHAAIRPGKQAVRYWGVCGTNQYNTAEILINAESVYVDTQALVNPLMESTVRKHRKTYELDAADVRVSTLPAGFLDSDIRYVKFGDAVPVNLARPGRPGRGHPLHNR